MLLCHVLLLLSTKYQVCDTYLVDYTCNIPYEVFPLYCSNLLCRTRVCLTSTVLLLTDTQHPVFRADSSPYSYE